MKRNFNELFSKMKPEAQERVKVRSGELLKEISLLEVEGATTVEDVLAPSGANSKASKEPSPQRARANRKVVVQGSK